VIDEVRARVASGYKEVVLTGTKIGAYGGDGVGLEHLVEHILSETGVKRLRLSSLQPQDLVPSLIEMWADQRLCRHFHISLQSGSDPVLRRMGRNYSVADYEWAVSLVRKTIPGVAITTDVIVGFPGESAEEFEENYQFCRKMSFARIHVFPYSARVGTAASKMPHQVEDRIKRERCQRMIELARESARNFREQFLGEMAEVLWERQVGESWSGLTDNYIRVFTLSNEALNNRLASVRLLSQLKEGLLGSLTPS
jgi:threonylcarbamoyladenosine tRNA methylthiotransferase MtaB